VNVGEVAALAGVTVRTLHHYDRIGLLSPSGRTTAGYRRYSAADLDRLHQVLLYRELGFPLEEVATLLDDPSADPAAVEKEMEAMTMGISLTPEERFELFGDWLPEEYEQEAEERWGDTEAWSQSQARTRSYTKEDWVRVQAEGEQVEARMAEALRAGVAPDSPQAMDLAEEARQQISRNFYDCSPQMHAGIGRMYVEDERFTAHYERRAPGLAQWVSTAVQANAARQGA
jgi:DNA-binding transcriptional MerR regulator